jgi:hypothetical protein
MDALMVDEKDVWNPNINVKKQVKSYLIKLLSFK